MLNEVGAVSVHSTYITDMSTSLVTALMAHKPSPARGVLPGVIGAFLLGDLGGTWLVTVAGVAGFTASLMPVMAAILLSAR